MALHLDEAAVERQVVSDGVLPGSLVGAVVGEPLHDELVDARQGDALLGALLDGHGYQSYVADTQRHTLQSGNTAPPVVRVKITGEENYWP